MLLLLHDALVCAADTASVHAAAGADRVDVVPMTVVLVHLQPPIEFRAAISAFPATTRERSREDCKHERDQNTQWVARVRASRDVGVCARVTDVRERIHSPEPSTKRG